MPKPTTAVTVTDNRESGGDLTISLAISNAPKDLSDRGIHDLLKAGIREARKELSASATPDLVTQATLREASSRGIIDARAVRSILSLEDELRGGGGRRTSGRLTGESGSG